MDLIMASSSALMTPSSPEMSRTVSNSSSERVLPAGRKWRARRRLTSSRSRRSGVRTRERTRRMGEEKRMSSAVCSSPKFLGPTSPKKISSRVIAGTATSSSYFGGTQ